MKVSKKNQISGFKDLGPQDMVQRNHILGLLKELFQKSGFVELQTAAVERLSMLMKNYGAEAEKLIYQVINNHQTKDQADKALRYDLTLPLARYVAMNQEALIFPFRRYQIQSVWRAERPQKGRYREFTQCDIDIVGGDNLQYEAELLNLAIKAVSLLRIENFRLQINHRALLNAVADKIGFTGSILTLARELDKVDKIGLEHVKKNILPYLKEAKKASFLNDLEKIEGPLPLALPKIEAIFGHNTAGAAACRELQTLQSYCKALKMNMDLLTLSPMLARGMSYYTGTVFEVSSKQQPAIGSFIGGGRYDKLTEQFGLTNVSGVGLSFGIDRIEDLWKLENKLLPQEPSTHLLLLPMEPATHLIALALATDLQNQLEEIVEVLPPQKKLQKGLRYADRKQIPLVGVLGGNEAATKQLTIKEMRTGDQKKVAFKQIEEHIKSYFTTTCPNIKK